jgi:carboxyl-terminal processing protease
MTERRRASASPFPKSILIIAFLFTTGIGYVGGMFHTQIIGSVAPLFGLSVFTGSLDLTSVQETYRQLQNNFDGTLDDAALIEGAHRGLVDAAGDRYTTYLNKEDSAAFDDSLTGSIGGGVGVELNIRNDQVTVIRVLADNPAAQAGILAGDVIISVNDESMEGLEVEQVVLRIRGEIGTTVKIGVSRNGTPQTYTVTRAEVNNPSVYSSVQDGVGILTITRFDSQTGSLARQAARSFSDQQVRSVVLDLRGNGGGFLTAAQDVAGIWLDNKIVVSERAKGKVIDELFSSSDPILEGMPTVVLVDGGTASASEIVAGALQEYNVASLIGEQTFGKGSVQQLIPLTSGAQLKVTIARWFTPKGKNISETGIVPNEKVERTAEDVNTGRDPQLEAALTRLAR